VLAKEVHRGRRSSVMPCKAPEFRSGSRIAGNFLFAKSQNAPFIKIALAKARTDCDIAINTKEIFLWACL
jgi:hypothetical protein